MMKVGVIDYYQVDKDEKLWLEISMNVLWIMSLPLYWTVYR